VGVAAGVAILTALAACTTPGADSQSAASTGSPAPFVAASPVASSAALATAAPSATAAPATAGPAGSAAGSGGGGRGDYDYGSSTTAAPSAAAGPQTIRVDVATSSGLTVLTGADGLTLYTFAPDRANASNCANDCAEAWPPFTIQDGDVLEAGDDLTETLTTFSRYDGTLQVAYDGAPLYYFSGDTAAGDATGQGIGDAWFVAEP
jgi:predicted lipoprotein with Yx(FWY)xxD motif